MAQKTIRVFNDYNNGKHTVFFGTEAKRTRTTITLSDKLGNEFVFNLKTGKVRGYAWPNFCWRIQPADAGY